MKQMGHCLKKFTAFGACLRTFSRLMGVLLHGSAIAHPSSLSMLSSVNNEAIRTTFCFKKRIIY